MFLFQLRWIYIRLLTNEYLSLLLAILHYQIQKSQTEKNSITHRNFRDYSDGHPVIFEQNLWYLFSLVPGWTSSSSTMSLTTSMIV